MLLYARLCEWIVYCSDTESITAASLRIAPRRATEGSTAVPGFCQATRWTCPLKFVAPKCPAAWGSSRARGTAVLFRGAPRPPHPPLRFSSPPPVINFCPCLTEIEARENECRFLSHFSAPKTSDDWAELFYDAIPFRQ